MFVFSLLSGHLLYVKCKYVRKEKQMTSSEIDDATKLESYGFVTMNLVILLLVYNYIFNGFYTKSAWFRMAEQKAQEITFFPLFVSQ